MADFIFHCPHCHTKIEAHDEWRGLVSQCPNCKREITIPFDDFSQEQNDQTKNKDKDLDEKFFVEATMNRLQNSIEEDLPKNKKIKDEVLNDSKMNQPQGEPNLKSPHKIPGETSFHLPAQKDHSASCVQDEDQSKDMAKKKNVSFFAKRLFFLWMVSGCACLLLIMNILFGLFLFFKKETLIN